MVHSVTKYLGGHSDLTGGALVYRRDDLHEPLWDQQAIAGGILSPFESWLLLRGMKTLAIRMRAHCENAMAVAR
ncbi:MAG: cystathionine gamma-synthase, partial [Armatimonadota bacterium]